MICLLNRSITLLFNSSSTTVPNFAKPYLTFQTDRTVYLHDYILCTRNWVYFAKFNTKLNIWPFCLQLLKQGFATGKCKTVSRCSISSIYCNARALGPCEWAAPSFPSPPGLHTLCLWLSPLVKLLFSIGLLVNHFFNTFQNQRTMYLRKSLCTEIQKRALFSCASVARTQRMYLILQCGCNSYRDANQGFSHQWGTGSFLPSTPVYSEPYFFPCGF